MKKRMLTHREVQRRVDEAIDVLLSDCGLPSVDRSKEIYRSLLRNQTGAEKAVGPVLSDLIREQFQREIKRLKITKCSEEQLKSLLAQIRSYAREIPSSLRRGIEEVKKSLPRHGGPGRKELLNTTEKREACEHVATLLKMGTSRLPDAFETVAEGFRAKGKTLSSKTIKRAWENRKDLYVG
jgi:hypothetical protein